MEFNVYKQIISREDLIRNLREKGMERVGDSKTYNSVRNVDGEEVEHQVTVDFFFKLDSDQLVEIQWANYWGSFFGEESSKEKTVESAFGLVVVTFNNGVYAISLGRGHSYTTNAADMDFGFDIAEIIHDPESIEVKAARYFKKSKSKALTQYNVNSFVTNEIGESHELLVSKITLNEKYSYFLLFQYAEKMKFGSAVKINVNDYKPEEVIDVLHELNYLLIHEERSGSLPRMHFIKENEDNQPLIADLNRNLTQAIKSKSVSVNLSYYIEDDGEIFVQPLSDEEFELVYKKSYTLETYSIDAIAEKLMEIECDDITKVSIRPRSDRNNKQTLMKVLDFNIALRGKNYCLYKGKWATFNDSYVDFIEREILRVNECAIYNEEYNLSKSVLEQGKEIQKSNTEKYDQVKYNEYPYNIYLENKLGLTLLDRQSLHENFSRVEFADLYDENNKELIHVKIGDTSDFRYCIQQSLHSADIFNVHRDVLEVYNVSNVDTVSMLFVTGLQRIFTDDGKVDFSKINSIYFKIEIIEWLKKMRTLNYNPRIIVAKKVISEWKGKIRRFKSFFVNGIPKRGYLRKRII